MRAVTREEAEAWMVLAKEHGHVNDHGEIAVGRFKVTDISRDGRRVGLMFMTQVVAGLYADDLKRKTPPIMFDRTESGEIILPGRWWARMWERTAELPNLSPEQRGFAMGLARRAIISDTTLPADTETIRVHGVRRRRQPRRPRSTPAGRTDHLASRPSLSGS